MSGSQSPAAAEAADRTLAFAPAPQASVRLLCLPHAGAGASIFRPWSRALPGWIEVRAVQLPGRDGRRREPLPPSVGALADLLAAGLGAAAAEPYALFGHSMGALLAFEVARRLEARGRPPVHVFLAGYGAPHVFRSTTRLHLMDHDEVVAELRRGGATPDVVAADPALMRLYVPILQADLALCAAHAEPDAEERPIATAISAFAGTADDEVPVEAVAAWADLTTGPFRLRTLPGGHFFPASARDALLAAVRRDLLPRRA
ncbi:MAG TPA: alpha/beta fold hydrolase [Solirubrobacteraceae bacterium]